MHLCARCNKSQRLFFSKCRFLYFKDEFAVLGISTCFKVHCRSVEALCVMYTVWKGKCWYARHMTRYLSYFEDGWEDTTETLLVPTIKALIYRNEEESAASIEQRIPCVAPLHYNLGLCSLQNLLELQDPLHKNYFIKYDINATSEYSMILSIVMNCIEIH